jgi:hypothetical protein
MFDRKEVDRSRTPPLGVLHAAAVNHEDLDGQPYAGYLIELPDAPPSFGALDEPQFWPTSAIPCYFGFGRSGTCTGIFHAAPYLWV